MSDSNRDNTAKPKKIPPLPKLPQVHPSPNIGPEVQEAYERALIAWQDSFAHCFEANRKMFETILKGFMKPFWLSIGMNVTVFVVGIVSFSIAMVLSLFTEQYLLGLIFAGIDAATFLTFFLSNPIENLEKDMGFVAWLGLTYNTYWTRSYYATDENTFQKDMQNVTDDAVKSLQQLLSTHKEVSKSRFLKPKSTSPTSITEKKNNNKLKQPTQEHTPYDTKRAQKNENLQQTKQHQSNNNHHPNENKKQHHH